MSDVFTTHSGIVHDVVDADCWAQNGGTHDQAFTVFKHQFLTHLAPDRPSLPALFPYRETPDRLVAAS